MSYIVSSLIMEVADAQHLREILGDVANRKVRRMTIRPSQERPHDQA